MRGDNAVQKRHRPIAGRARPVSDTMGAMDTEGKTDDLAAYLEAVGREDSFVVERRLGGGENATELVRFKGAGATALGPFVRKRIDLATGLGGAYEMLFELQRAGRRFVHLPLIVDCYKTGAELVVVSEYVPGETLEEVVDARGASLALAQEVFPGVCDAVEELHGACDPPLIHRDLKPQNIIVAPAGLFLIDFGIARRFREKAETDTVRFGTRAYAPPEQYGFGQTDVRSDIYALGGILWYCLTGDDPSASLAPHEVSERVGERLSSVICKAMAFDPAERFQSAAELARAFREAVGEAPGTADDGAPTTAEAGVVGAAGDARREDEERGNGFFRTHLLGVVRNIVLLLIALACIPQAWQGVVAPQAEYAGKSLGYLVVLNFLLTLPLVWGALYLAMDRTMLARLVPAIAQRSRLKDACIIGIYLAIAFVVALFIPSS